MWQKLLSVGTGTLVACMALSTRAADTAPALTLDQAVSELLRGSPRIERAQSAMNEASWHKVESYAGFLPVVSASANYLLSKKYLYTDIVFGGAPASIPAIVPTSIFALNAQWMLFDGLANVDRFRAAIAFERSSQDDFDWTQFQSERELILTFYKALAARELRDVAEQNLKTIEDHLRDVNSFRKAGLSTKYDELRVEVQRSEAQSELLNSSDNVEIAKNKLAELLGKESETRELAGALPALNESLLKNLGNRAREERKDLAALGEKTRALELQEAANGRFWVPKLGLFGQYQYYNNRNDTLSDWANYRSAYQLGLSLNWVFFDGLSSIAHSRESVEQRYQSQKSLRMAELKAGQDFEMWKRKYLYFCSVYRSRVGDVEKASESVRLAREGRRVGSRTNTELLDAESELFRARAGVVNSQIGAIEALINLELSTGQKLYDFN
jgi:outer membrane protein TolC